MKSLFSLLFLSALLIMYPGFMADAQTKKTSPVVVESPNGKIRFYLENKDGALTYAIVFNSAQVIEPSSLGLLINGSEIGSNIEIGKVTRYSLNETYPYRGVHTTAINHFNGAKVEVRSKESPFTIEAKVFNDGVAFRYIVDKKDSSYITKDLTSFTVAAGSTVWSQSNIKTYEGRYSKRKIESFEKGDLIGPPATIELPGNLGYASITEGGVTDFAGMSLIADSNHVFKANLAGAVHKKGIIFSPWRIVEIGADLNTLVNCDIIANVSPALDPHLFPKGYDTDWIIPGRSVWSYLTPVRSITLENMKRFTDLAAALGFEYNLVDEGWSNWKDGNKNCWDMMKELVDYSAAKGVKIWVWKAYPDRRGIEGIKDSVKRKAFFEHCKQIGIAGMKIDFFDSEDQEVIDFYQSALRDGAKLHLMFNFHGANKPTGETRTWPNEMSREAVRGMENQAPWAPGNTIFPFTRFLAGHADFTPIHFGVRMGEISWAQHIATMVVYTSPFQCVGADPKDIMDNPAKELIKSIPTTWDETIVLPQSKIGELALYARRKGNTWFLAAINGTNEPKKLTVQLSFLKNGKFKISSVQDDPQKQANAIVGETNVTSKSLLTIDLNGAGGYVGMVKKIN